LSNNQDLPTLDSHVNTLEGTNKEADSKKDTEVFQSSELSKLAKKILKILALTQLSLLNKA